MPAATIRANYDQLKQVASTFGKNSDECKRTLQSIQSNKETLQGGDWIGQGASAFYKEMDDSVLPTLKRLVNALDSAQSSVAQISSIMQGAEQQASKVLQGGASGGAAGAAAGGATAGGAAGAAAGAAGGAAGAASGGAAGAAAGGAAGAAAGAAGGATAAGAGAAAAGAAGGSAASQIAQLTNEATQAVSSLSDVSDGDLNSAVNQLGNLASQYDNIVPPNYQPDNTGIGPLLSAIGSPNADQIGQQLSTATGGGSASSGGAPASGGGSASSGGGGSSGGGSSGGGSSGGGGGAPSAGGASGQAMQGFSDQALTSLMNNPNLPPSDRMLAMAIETLRRDPNAFNGALKQFVDQALGQGATGPAANAVGGGISALAGAAGIAAGGSPPQGTMDAINSLGSQYNNIVQGGGAGASASGPATTSPVGPSGSTAPSAPPASSGSAILNLVQQFIQTVDAVIPKD